MMTFEKLANFSLRSLRLVNVVTYIANFQSNGETRARSTWWEEDRGREDNPKQADTLKSALLNN